MTGIKQKFVWNLFGSRPLDAAMTIRAKYRRKKQRLIENVYDILTLPYEEIEHL